MIWKYWYTLSTILEIPRKNLNILQQPTVVLSRAHIQRCTSTYVWRLIYVSLSKTFTVVAFHAIRSLIDSFIPYRLRDVSNFKRILMNWFLFNSVKAQTTNLVSEVVPPVKEERLGRTRLSHFTVRALLEGFLQKLALENGLQKFSVSIQGMKWFIFIRRVNKKEDRLSRLIS